MIAPYGTDHPTIVCCSRVALIVTVDLYIDTECPLDGVNGAVTRSYIGLAEYPVARKATGYSVSGTLYYFISQWCANMLNLHIQFGAPLQLECGPMPNVMVALLNIDSALFNAGKFS